MLPLILHGTGVNLIDKGSVRVITSDVNMLTYCRNLPHHFDDHV